MEVVVVVGSMGVHVVLVNFHRCSCGSFDLCCFSDPFCCGFHEIFLSGKTCGFLHFYISTWTSIHGTILVIFSRVSMLVVCILHFRLQCLGFHVFYGFSFVALLVPVFVLGIFYFAGFPFSFVLFLCLDLCCHPCYCF